MEVDYVMLFIAWILLLTAWLSVMGNGTILLTVIKNPSLRKRDCLYLIASLAVADFITGTFVCQLRVMCNHSYLTSKPEYVFDVDFE